MKRIKKSLVIIAFNVITGSSVFASGFPVFDGTNLTTAIDSLYKMYDFINNQIEMVENTYKMIEQQAKAIWNYDWSETPEMVWSDNPNGLLEAWENIGKARQNYKRVNSFVSSRLDAWDTAQQRILNQGIEIPVGNDGDAVKFTWGDLLGDGATALSTGKGTGKTVSMLTALKDFNKNVLKGAADGFTGRLSPSEKYRIMRKYGVSPATYYKSRFVSELVGGTLEKGLMNSQKELDLQLEIEHETQNAIFAMTEEAAQKESLNALMQANIFGIQKTIEAIDNMRHEMQTFAASDEIKSLGKYLNDICEDAEELELEVGKNIATYYVNNYKLKQKD